MRYRQSILIFLLCSLVLAFGQARGTIRVCRYNKADYLLLSDVALFYGMNCQRSGREIEMVSRHETMRFLINSRVATINGVDVILSRAVADLKGVLLIGKSDFQTLLDPVLRPQTVPRHKVRKIVIDPGHGGRDTGCIGTGKNYEKNVNLQVALRLAHSLHKRGFLVYMTRSEDTDLTLEQRCQFTNNIRPDFFISLHCNSAASPSVCGVETYISTPVGDIAAGSKSPATTKCSSNFYDLESAFTAYTVQKYILSRTGMLDRGVKRMRYYVVRNVSCPAMLVEMGFLTNNAELAFLKHPYRQQQIADAIADAFSAYRANVK